MADEKPVEQPNSGLSPAALAALFLTPYSSYYTTKDPNTSGWNVSTDPNNPIYNTKDKNKNLFAVSDLDKSNAPPRGWIHAEQRPDKAVVVHGADFMGVRPQPNEFGKDKIREMIRALQRQFPGATQFLGQGDPTGQGLDERGRVIAARPNTNKISSGDRVITVPPLSNQPNNGGALGSGSGWGAPGTKLTDLW